LMFSVYMWGYFRPAIYVFFIENW